MGNLITVTERQYDRMIAEIAAYRDEIAELRADLVAAGAQIDTLAEAAHEYRAQRDHATARLSGLACALTAEAMLIA